ncbi:hypothetical protein ONZ45_g17081 [Pleurotus djamor]|nr:hypothetical protein ONZ45_g17081 [Pleurotus djamor]
MSSMKAYLAEKYMSGPKADAILARTSGKKKKRKTATATSASGAFLVDDDAGWGNEAKGDDGDDMEDVVVASDRGFKKRKVEKAEGEAGGWATLQEGIKAESPPPAADEQPMVVDEPAKPFTGGLVSAKQLKKAMAPKKQESKATAEEIAAAQETVYRDASGKKIDTKAERAEAARLKREREEREAKKMEWGKGLVQRDEAERRKKELDDLKGKNLRNFGTILLLLSSQ